MIKSSRNRELSRLLRILLSVALGTIGLALISPPSQAQDSTWRRVGTMRNAIFSDLECRSNGVCVLAGQLLEEAMVWLSTDAGHTWRDVYRHNFVRGTPAVTFSLVQFIGDSTLIVGTTKGLVARSTDLGRTFEFIEVTDTGQTRFLQMDDRGRGSVIFGDHPLYRLFTTDDSGTTWNPIPLPESVRFGDTLRGIPGPRVAMTSSWRVGVNKLILLCVSDPEASVLTTVDQGATWSEEYRGSEATSWFEFVDSSYGFLYGGAAVYLDPGDEKPAIFKTTDAGATWNRSLIGARIRDLATHDGRRIIAVGELNKVYISNDSGLTWQKDSFPIRSTVTSWCELPDSSSGIIVGAFGQFFLKEAISAVDASRDEHRGPSVRAVEGAILIEHPPGTVDVQVRLYDILGRLVENVTSRRLDATRSLGMIETAARPGQVLLAVVDVDGRSTTHGTIVIVR